MIDKNIYRVTCDVKNCKNIAEFVFTAKGRMGKFYICRECLSKLAGDYSKLVVPKSPKNVIKKAMDNKKESIAEIKE